MGLFLKVLKNWKKISLDNLSFYYELFQEERGRFRYPPDGTHRFTPHIIKKQRMAGLLEKSKRLHIGCGSSHADGFINIDAFKTPATDFVCHIQDLPKYVPPRSAEFIYLSHTLEHFSIKDSKEVLTMFYDFLQDKGELRLSVPDMLKLAEIAKKKSLGFDDKVMLRGVMMGGQDTRYNYHKSVYWFDFLQEMLKRIGFRQVEEYQIFPHFIKDFSDASSLARIDNELISLNVRAVK